MCGRNVGLSSSLSESAAEAISAHRLMGGRLEDGLVVQPEAVPERVVVEWHVVFGIHHKQGLHSQSHCPQPVQSSQVRASDTYHLCQPAQVLRGVARSRVGHYLMSYEKGTYPAGAHSLQKGVGYGE
ncbi:hypothetical protein EI94DRAFT_1704699 [Lactarius quietus]|nr:hypothetical protein EI94DRAFT_1704699 [Lactarius quietus]